MVILNDLTVAKTSDLTPFAELSFRKDHKLDVANAQYHRSQWGFA